MRLMDFIFYSLSFNNTFHCIFIHLFVNAKNSFIKISGYLLTNSYIYIGWYSNIEHPTNTKLLGEKEKKNIMFEDSICE